MSNISNMFINAVLADAAYADDLTDGLSGAGLILALNKRMSPTLAKFISDNFVVVAHRESNDVIGSGFDATVWRGVGTAYAGQIFVSMQGTEGLQDFLTDANLALPFSAARRQLVAMVNWWNLITTPTNVLVTQIQETSLADVLGFSQTPALSLYGTGLLTNASSVQVNGHSLGGHLASAFARLFGDRAGGVAIISGVRVTVISMNAYH